MKFLSGAVAVLCWGFREFLNLFQALEERGGKSLVDRHMAVMVGGRRPETGDLTTDPATHYRQAAGLQLSTKFRATIL